MIKFYDTKILEIEVNNVERPDVAALIPSESLNTGFYCAFDMGLLPMEERSYKLGIRYVYGEQEYHIWSEKTLDIVETKLYTYSEMSKNNRKTWKEKNVMANLDAVTIEGKKAKLTGWAFETNHQLYNNFVRKQVLLQTKDGTVYGIRVKDECRLDMLKMFEGIPNLLWSGFSAEVEVEDEEMLKDCRWGVVLENLETHNTFYKYF